MYKVSPTGKLFFLRLLLLQAKGATFWEDLRTVNGIVLETFREACVLKETDNLNEINNYHVEFLNSLTPSGMTTHCLKLIISCVIMLYRSLDLKAGLFNGTQIEVCALKNNYIDAEVLTGVSEGKRVFVPRIQLAPLDSNLPFVLKRRQFSVGLAYSMTINISQGQSFDRPVFVAGKPASVNGKPVTGKNQSLTLGKTSFVAGKPDFVAGKPDFVTGKPDFVTGKPVVS
ncbi:uncharacterized protein LOC136089644 [Hydra vulgaris]|uniref:Uncharacterized protein LOC136089644 n=1 Tax=Hydra vulgaris TaxID=6087 RepID=A0ABM4DBL9_HYDVU